MKKASQIIQTIIVAAVLVVIIIFSFQNLDKVDVRFFNTSVIQIPLFLIVFGILAAGIIVGYLIGLLSGSKISKKKIGEINISANEKIAEETKKIKAELEQKIQAKENNPTQNQ